MAELEQAANITEESTPEPGSTEAQHHYIY
jgi:hypothetical protein